MKDVGFLGAGLLASGMIEAMLNRGRRVTVWNRTEARAAVTATPAERDPAHSRVISPGLRRPG